MQVDVKILGTDCARCRQLTALVEDVLAGPDMPDAALEKVSDLAVIMSYGILAVPGLVINGEVKSVGNVPSGGMIAEWIREAAKE
ncbi:MAG: thioredoxin family protein [Planctomycetes bacterium]|nr:thioredoxin family protein [Planctomycetota bacterium]